MQCKNELEYLIVVLNDYIGTLPLSSKVAVGERVQQCVTAIDRALNPQVEPETPADSQ